MLGLWFLRFGLHLDNTCVHILDSIFIDLMSIWECFDCSNLLLVQAPLHWISNDKLGFFLTSYICIQIWVAGDIYLYFDKNPARHTLCLYLLYVSLLAGAFVVCENMVCLENSNNVMHSQFMFLWQIFCLIHFMLHLILLLKLYCLSLPRFIRVAITILMPCALILRGCDCLCITLKGMLCCVLSGDELCSLWTLWSMMRLYYGDDVVICAVSWRW